MRRGYLPAAAVIILALITLAVAFVIYFNRDLILKTKTDQSTQPALTSPSPIAKISPAPSPTPDETANWKTYTSDKWQWTVKYPDKGHVVTGGANCSRKGGGEEENTICFFSPDFSADYRSGFGLLVYSEAFDSNFANSCFSLPADKCQELTVAGQKATKFPTDYTKPNIINEEDYYFSFPNKSKITLTFSYIPCKLPNDVGCFKKEDAKKLINQILSTFKFL